MTIVHRFYWDYGKYGFKLHIEIFRLNFIIKIFRHFDTESTVGFRNSTGDGKRLVFLDYENILFKEHLLPELKYLQNRFHLSDFYIFKSSQKEGNYHVICLDKLNGKLWCDVVEQTNVDQNYKRIPIYVDNKSWVLRFFPKGKSHQPRFIGVMKSRFNNRQKSNAHALLLHYHYGIRINHLRNLDKNTNVTTTLYKTLNYIKTKKYK